jgi:hypothetical protein
MNLSEETPLLPHSDVIEDALNNIIITFLFIFFGAWILVRRYYPTLIRRAGYKALLLLFACINFFALKLDFLVWGRITLIPIISIISII